MERFTIELSPSHVTNLVEFCRNNCVFTDYENTGQLTAPNISNLTFTEKTSHIGFGLNQSSDLCAICLSQLKKGSIVPVLNCRHTFHKKCLDQWFSVAQELECPVCRKSNLFDQPINRIIRRTNAF